jgi:hypothetical protein
MPKQKKSTKIANKVKDSSSRKKRNVDVEVAFSNNENPLFCTECDKELDAFWMSKKSKNPDAVKINHNNCRETGKFKGEFCSKLFIIDKKTLEEIWMEDEE